MANAINLKGDFISDGTPERIAIRSDVDGMMLYNLTRIEAGGAGTVVRAYWQRGMDPGYAITWTKLAADDSEAINYIATGGFTLYDDSDDPVGGLNATLTQVGAGPNPTVLCTDTTGLSNGDVVRLVNVPGAHQLGGIDFEIANVVVNTSFDLIYMDDAVVTTGAVAGGFRRIDRYSVFYPRKRYISDITAAASAVITLTVDHDYVVGEEVKIVCPAIYDMEEINGLTAKVTAIDSVSNDITVDIDSTGFTAFAFPITTDGAFTPAHIVPIGGDGSDIGVTQDTGSIGIRAGSAICGTADDLMIFTCDKSFSVNN